MTSTIARNLSIQELLVLGGVSENFREISKREITFLSISLSIFKVSDFESLPQAIKQILLNNHVNEGVPKAYIDKYATQFIQTNSIPYKIFSTFSAFCAVLDDGSIKTWGELRYGGTPPEITNLNIQTFNT